MKSEGPTKAKIEEESHHFKAVFSAENIVEKEVLDAKLKCQDTQARSSPFQTLIGPTRNALCSCNIALIQQSHTEPLTNNKVFF